MSANSTTQDQSIRYVSYGNERESPFLPAIRQLISNDLSEPYSIYVYRYFLYQWGDLCFMALDSHDEVIGVIVCKLEAHRSSSLSNHSTMRGYIAMLATRKEFRGRGIATRLVRLAMQRIISLGADEIVLETEVDNVPSLRIYENLGFVRTKRLHRYYLNGNTAFRLILYVEPGSTYDPDSTTTATTSTAATTTTTTTTKMTATAADRGLQEETIAKDDRSALVNKIDECSLIDEFDERFNIMGGGTTEVDRSRQNK